MQTTTFNKVLKAVRAASDLNIGVDKDKGESYLVVNKTNPSSTSNKRGLPLKLRVGNKNYTPTIVSGLAGRLGHLHAYVIDYILHTGDVEESFYKLLEKHFDINKEGFITINEDSDVETIKANIVAMSKTFIRRDVKVTVDFKDNNFKDGRSLTIYVTGIIT